MPTAPLAQARQRTGELARESGPVGDLGQQRGARVRHQPRSVRRDTYRKRASFAHHPQGDPPRPGSRTFSKPKNPGPTGRSGAPTPIGALALTHDRGLNPPDDTRLTRQRHAIAQVEALGLGSVATLTPCPCRAYATRLLRPAGVALPRRPERACGERQPTRPLVAH